MSNGTTYSEAALLAASNYVVVLAEPGGGKTELMGSLARQLGTTAVTARKFGLVGAKSENAPLVIDAFDELAKVDAGGIDKVLKEAVAANPTHVYLSSRSSEWGTAATRVFEDFLGHSPVVVRLCEFDEAEQRAIFEHHVRGEDFATFHAEVARFDLEMLLPNPQFLKLFAGAYIESGRHFTDKRSIFVQAVERLAKEANDSVGPTNPTLSITQKIGLSSEVFAKILLSGAEGVSTSEATEDRVYPLLTSLFRSSTAADGILSTRLFKPGESVDQHRPVHKIVAEYCAADYLTKRIEDSADPLTLRNCLPIIAPNSTVRDELRGLLGWMAALGSKTTQLCAIELDPYAVLANGDPSQLEQTSKRLLLHQLKEAEADDPYFRRGDLWRSFSAAGFFTREVVDEIKPLLVSGSDGQLRDLILELLAGAPVVGQLRNELRQLTLNPQESANTRMLANRCLLEIARDSYAADLAVLIFEASRTSLQIAADTIETLGPEAFELANLAGFFRVCAKLYPGHQERMERTIGARYFIKCLMGYLPLQIVQWLLDELSKDLTCNCGLAPYECDCRNGLSKIIGVLLDRYFELAEPPFDPVQVWQWIRNLNFHEEKGADRSRAVKAFRENDSLRQGIIAHAFAGLTDHDRIAETKRFKFDWHCHSGLHFQVDDIKFMVDFAFEADNPVLWAEFIAQHQYYRVDGARVENDLRRHMRRQALEKPAFLREWVNANRAMAQLERRYGVSRFRRTRRMKRRRRQEDDNRAAEIKYIRENRAFIEAGRDWHSCVRFARLVLDAPGKIAQEVGDETLVRNTLRNCLNFIAPHVPDLRELAELQCTSKIAHSEWVLYASCVEIMRVEGNLERVDRELLLALRTNMRMHYSAVSEDERIALKAEVDRLVLPDQASAENFLREYVEPQLAHPACAHPEVGLLRDEEAFRHLCAKVSIEWLRRFPGLAIEPTDTLFEIAAQYGNRDDLVAIILERYGELMSDPSNPTQNEDVGPKRKFWLLRAWYFLDCAPDAILWGRADTTKDAVSALFERSRQMDLRGNSSWPKLTSRKAETILSGFIDNQPEAYLQGSCMTNRFVDELIGSINSDNPDYAIPVLDRLLSDRRFAGLHKNLKSVRADQVRNKALRDFEPPAPREIVDRLDCDAVVTVEGLRQLVIDELIDFQKAITGGEYNVANRFYEKSDRLDEERCTEIIAERLSLRLQPQSVTVTPEHQLKASKRSDFTLAKLIGGKRRLLVTEVKGQWHRELYTAASAQLYDRYSIHPDAEEQGIFLVIWFGHNEMVAGRLKHEIKSAQELKNSIEAELPPELAGRIDIFVLDVAKRQDNQSGP